MRWIGFVVLFPLIFGQVPTQTSPPSAGQGSDAQALMTDRLIKSLPHIPKVIEGQMLGSADELKKMVSSVLGDGLISQLVVNPLGVAEDMGLSMDKLGVNKTEVIEKLNNATNGMAGQYLASQPTNLSNNTVLFGDNSLQKLFTTPPPTTTTEPKMYVDGVPIEDFDEYIRKYNLRDADGRPMFKTKKPPTTTTPMPSAQQIAETVLEALSKRAETAAPSMSNTPAPHSSDLGLPLDLIDPNRVGEVSNLLGVRRAPQNFDTLSDVLPQVAAMPAPTPTMLDPQISNVLTTIRTKSLTGLTVEEVKQLQGALQQYEQTLQTKELYSKRKQLQVLQNELIEQRKHIEIQKQREHELMEKEKELQKKRQEVELEFQKQLNSWHSSFNSHPPGVDMPTLSPYEHSLSAGLSDPIIMGTAASASQFGTITPDIDRVPQFEPTFGSSLGSGLQAPPATFFSDMPSISIAPANPPSSFKIEEETAAAPAPAEPHLPSALQHQLRYSPSSVDDNAREIFDKAPEEDQHDDELSSPCECIEVDLNKLKGSWVQSLASVHAIEQIQQSVSYILQKEGPANLTCSRLEFSTPKQSQAAQEAHVLWEFGTQESKRDYRLRGNALTIDHVTTRMKLTDPKGRSFVMPFCILKSGGDDPSSEYLVIVNSKGPCKQASLLVRDSEKFFDNNNSELVTYLKHKMRNNELDKMEVVPFAKECRHL